MLKTWFRQSWKFSTATRSTLHSLELFGNLRKRTNKTVLFRKMQKGAMHSLVMCSRKMLTKGWFFFTIKPSTDLGLQNSSWLTLLVMCFGVSLMINTKGPLRYTEILSNYTCFFTSFWELKSQKNQWDLLSTGKIMYDQSSLCLILISKWVLLSLGETVIEFKHNPVP